MNSRTKFSKKRLECGFGVHLEEQKEVVSKMIEATQNMKRVGKRGSHYVPFQKGIIISCSSLLSLYSALSKERGVEFILTSHLNQDALENFFSRVRALGGSNTHPTSVDFLHRTKSLIVGKAADLMISSAVVEMEEDYESQTGFLSQLATSSFETNNS